VCEREPPAETPSRVRDLSEFWRGWADMSQVQILRRKELGSRLRLPAPASLTPAKLLNLCNLRPNLAFIP
jgi:hypothetical protein